jgi:predicted enzyme related to lactoylglutathione lyase
MASPNAFVWYELMTTDLDSAERFYKKVIGWSAKDSGQPDMRYTIMSAGETMIAGMMSLPDEVRAAGGQSGWMGYVGVDDVDAATERVRKAGGMVFRDPADIPGVGRFAVVADPQGAAFMLFQPMGGNGASAPAGTPGHVGWRELYASDWETAFDFYAGQFGWTKKDAMDMGAMGVYQMFAAGADAIGGMMTKPDAVPQPAWLFYFNVDDADAAAERIVEGGGQVVNGPMQVPGGGWIVQGLDPQGALFAVYSSPR